MRRLRFSRSVRARIALNIFAVSTGLLLLMSIAVYVVFERSLMTSLDDTLRLRSAADSQIVDVSQSPPTLLIGGDPGGERATGEAVLRLYRADGTLLADASPVTAISAEERALVALAINQGQPLIRTIDFDDDEDYRVITTPVRVNGAVSGVLLTGIERSRVIRPLDTLRYVLIVADAITAVALALGSYRIAQQALRPVAALTETAIRITRGDLHERVEGAEVRDELGKLAATFNTMLARIGATIERERRFTADASHELRTPLATVETSIDVTLSQEREPAEYRRVLTIVRTQTKRLHTLANQLLLLSRLDDGRLQQQFARLELNGLVEAVVEHFQSRHEAATVNVADTSEVLEIDGDYELIGRALSNLLENAAVHVGPAVHLSVELRRHPDGSIMLSVEDDGPGIPETLAPEVFQRFRQANSSRTGKGTGLGLAIVESIVHIHGGSIVLAPAKQGTGARFEMILPPALSEQE